MKVTRLFRSYVNEYVGRDDPIILEIGSRDMREAEELARAYPGGKVFSFEANPAQWPQCEKRCRRYPNLFFEATALADFQGTAKFHQVVPSLGGENIGASSLLEFRGNTRERRRSAVQTVEVPCTTIESFCQKRSIARVDAIWIDVQGAELKVFRGAGPFLRGVSVIHTEASFAQYYEGQPLYAEVEAFMQREGFEQAWTRVRRDDVSLIRDWEVADTDVIYVRHRLSRIGDSDGTGARLPDRTRISDMCRTIEFAPSHVVEVGTWRVDASSVREFIESGVRTTVFEPDPIQCAAIREAWRGKSNVEVVERAVYKRAGNISMCRAGICSTFVEDVSAPPAIVNDKYVRSDSDRIEVEAITFDQFDPGDIDLLAVDAEGCEWYVRT